MIRNKFMIVELYSSISVEPCIITYCCLNDITACLYSQGDQHRWFFQSSQNFPVCLSLVISILCQNTKFSSSVMSRRGYFSPYQNKTTSPFSALGCYFEMVVYEIVLSSLPPALFSSCFLNQMQSLLTCFQNYSQLLPIWPWTRGSPSVLSHSFYIIYLTVFHLKRFGLVSLPSGTATSPDS